MSYLCRCPYTVPVAAQTNPSAQLVSYFQTAQNIPGNVLSPMTALADQMSLTCANLPEHTENWVGMGC